MLAPLGGFKPMSWFSSPKVRLALIVNGLYFLSLFTTPWSHHKRPGFFERARATRAARPERAALLAQPEHVPLPPPSAPSRASAYESGGLLHVSLTKDLTLVRRPGRTLLLSPSFSVRTYPREEENFKEPNAVLLNFIIYADGETCPSDCPLTIAADDMVVWPNYARAGAPAYSPVWKRERVPHSSTKSADGQVVETMAAESLSMRISYEQFLDTISARRVVVKLGPDRVELTADQIEALRDMHRRLPQPHDDSESY